MGRTVPSAIFSFSTSPRDKDSNGNPEGFKRGKVEKVNEIIAKEVFVQPHSLVLH